MEAFLFIFYTTKYPPPQPGLGGHWSSDPPSHLDRRGLKYLFNILFFLCLFVPGVNSGVMLMNLTRMREVKWLDEIVPYYKKYKYAITWGDQDLINIYFHFFPGIVADIYYYNPAE